MPSLVQNKIEGQIATRRRRDGSLAIEQDWHFRIQADSLDQSRESILHSTEGVPRYGVVYGAYALQLVGAEGNRIAEHNLLWDCVYHLSNTVEDGENTNPNNGEQQTGDPTLWIPVCELKFEEYDEVFRASWDIDDDEKHPDLGGSDADGYNARNWTNSAGRPYEQGFVCRRRIIVREFCQFEKATGVGGVSIDEIEARDDSLNKVPFLGRPKRTLKLNVLGAVLGFYYGVRCWRIDYSLAFKKDDWRIKMNDVGWSYVDPSKHPDPINPESPPAQIFRKPFLDSNQPTLGSLNGKGQPATNQFRPAKRYHKGYRSMEWPFLRVT